MFFKRIPRIVYTVVAAVLVIGLIGIQLVPVDRSNPPVKREPNWDKPETKALMKRACFDCHSNETVWPWYAKVAPMSWLVADHVYDGRKKINYSDWDPNEENESIEEIEKGAMPLKQYLWMHPEARLTPAEKDVLIAGLKATFGPGEGEGGDEGDQKSGETGGDKDND